MFSIKGEISAMKINPADLDRTGLHELFMSTVLPRPIAWVSTIGKNGVNNVAPFSCFTTLCLNPAIIAVNIGWKRDGQKKDTLRNIEFSHDFVIAVVDEKLAEAMNRTSGDYPPEIDEFKETGLTPVKSEIIRSPRVAESPINMECKLHHIIEFGKPPTGSHGVLGEVVLVHVNDELWIEDHVDNAKLKAIGRLGEDLYCRTMDTFEMKRPRV